MNETQELGIRIRQTMYYDIPLHDETGYIAQLLLPRDLSQEECDRLCATIRILAVPAVTQ